MNEQPAPLNCAEAAEQLYAYLDGELTPDLEAAVRSHLKDCAPCFQLFGFEEAYLRFLEARTRAAGAPPELKRRVLDSLLFENGRPDSP